jgi:hypothetical protein
MRSFILVVSLLLVATAAFAQVYVNEVDYDQPSIDAGEFIEIVGPANGSLDGYTIELVNGNGGAVYRTVDLTGLFLPNDVLTGYGFLVIGSPVIPNVDFTPGNWPMNDAIQNGAPDGILLKLNGVVVDGFSYEGQLTANPEFTAGMAISASENGNIPNLSIGRMLLGYDPNDQNSRFAQAAYEPSPGEPNWAHGQVFGDELPPVINSASIARTPKIPDAGQNTTVSAQVTDDGTVVLVELRYAISGGATQAVTMTNTGGDTYSGDIPESAYDNANRVEYWIYAKDDLNLETESGRAGFFAGNTPLLDLHAANANGVLLYLSYDARVTGVATVAPGVFSTTNLDVYLQDAGGGIGLFAYGLDPGLIMTVGNSYTVTGEVAQYNGKTEITPEVQLSDIVDNGPSTIPGAAVRTIAELLADAETYEGVLVSIAHVSNSDGGDPWPAAGSNANVEISDDGGASLIVLRIDSDTNIDGTPEPVWPVNIQGIFSQFDIDGTPLDGGYQVLPRSTDDLDVTVGVEPGGPGHLASEVSLQGNYPNPFSGGTTLRFEVPAARGTGTDVRLRVYNALGQQIATLVDGMLSPGSYEVKWSLPSERGASAPGGGVYFARLEIAQGPQQVIKLVLMR